MNLPSLKEARKRSKEKVEVIYLDNKEDKIVSNKKYFLRTYGCQMNVHDSEQIKFILESLGYVATDNLDDADIVVLNTCAIRENVHDKVFGYLGRCKHLKQSKKDLIVCLGGCMAQEEVVVNEIK